MGTGGRTRILEVCWSQVTLTMMAPVIEIWWTRFIPEFVNKHNKQMQADWNSTHKTFPDDKIAEVKSVFQGVYDKDAKNFTENVDVGVDECVILLKKMYTDLKSGPKKRKLVENFDGANAKEVCNAYTTFKRIFEGANGATELARNL